MKKLTALMLVLFVVIAFSPTGWAASPWTMEETPGDQRVGKLMFGLKNTLLGWTEILREPVEDLRSSDHHPVVAPFVGLGRGVVHAVVDTVGGVLHVVTFPLTSVDVPLPEDGQDLLKCGMCKKE